MDCTKLYVLRDHSGYAIELPLSGLNDPNFTKVIRDGEEQEIYKIVKDDAELDEGKITQKSAG